MFDKLESDMAVVKGSNSQLQQDPANIKEGKRNLPFSSSSSSSSEDEDDNPPPAAQPARTLPPPQRSPSPPPYSPATYSLAHSSTPSPTPIHTSSQGTSEERCMPATPSAIRHPAPGTSTPPQPQPQTAPTTAPAATSAKSDSPPGPATITYYAPPGASFIFDNETEIQISWARAGYGKFVCVNYSQRAFKLAFPKQLELFAIFLDLCSTSPQAATDQKQAYEYYKWSLPLFSQEFKRKVHMCAHKGHPQLSSDGLLPHSEDFQLSLEKARLDKTSPEVFTRETVLHTQTYPEGS
ncbi:hypothetical protein Pcinc_020999 [Petrolisthes cinctipes]|uniref:Uncharacterized protein n=1 Tax=Petrolisthes cinctipes TaxID=88211 RepID=A0AAE1FII5_PETCI|nr:hypothetical protein Pcinc_020999 [Petrolisthes cinctipes]